MSAAAVGSDPALTSPPASTAGSSAVSKECSQRVFDYLIQALPGSALPTTATSSTTATATFTLDEVLGVAVAVYSMVGVSGAVSEKPELFAVSEEQRFLQALQRCAAQLLRAQSLQGAVCLESVAQRTERIDTRNHNSGVQPAAAADETAPPTVVEWCSKIMKQLRAVATARGTLKSPDFRYEL
jgi:hypothetical protein